jgi:hypothetical protein
MFCPRAFHTSGSLGVLLGALLCWLCIVLWFFCCLPCVCVLVGWLWAYVTSAPRFASGCSRLLQRVWWFVPPTFHSCVLLAAGLFRVEHQSPFVSLGNAALATSPNSPSRQVITGG